MTTDLTTGLVEKARIMSGESTSSNNIPFIPTLKINNTSEIKNVTIGGEEKEVKVLASQGFTITNKIDGEYRTEFFNDKLEGVALITRYIIKSKYQYDKENPTSFYTSSEFGTWDENIKVFQNGKQFTSGTYKELKKYFETEELDSMGNKKRSFNLFLLIYLKVGEEIFKFEWKAGPNNNWFNYLNSFTADETVVGIKTSFELKKATVGDNTFWYATAVKGEKIDLEDSIKKQTEIYHYFNTIKEARQGVKEEPQESQLYTNNEPVKQIKDSDDIDVSQIPF